MKTGVRRVLDFAAQLLAAIACSYLVVAALAWAGVLPISQDLDSSYLAPDLKVGYVEIGICVAMLTPLLLLAFQLPRIMKWIGSQRK